MKITAAFLQLSLKLISGTLLLTLSCLLFPRDNHISRQRLTPVDLSSVTTDSYHPGRLYVKLTSQVREHIHSQVYRADYSTFFSQHQDFVRLNETYLISDYKPLLSDLYLTLPASIRNEPKYREYGFDLWFELTLDDKADIIAAVKDFMSLKEIEAAEPVYIKEALQPDEGFIRAVPLERSRWIPNDLHYENQWHLHNTGQIIREVEGVPGADIKAQDAWDIETGLRDVIVAVFDQGIGFTHEDLRANMWENIGPQGTDTRPGIHGTFVAGIVAAETNNEIGIAGIAGGSGNGDGVRLMSCAVLGEGSLNYPVSKLYAVEQGAAISQNSWAYSAFNVYNQVDLDAITYFNIHGGGNVMQGGITFFGAGNDDSNQYQYPAYYQDAIAVAATDNRDLKWSSSNYGYWIDISAPGRNVFSSSLENDYFFSSGTSFACPHVSGAAALLISYAYRNKVILTGNQLKNILLDTCDDITTLNPDYEGMLGAGRLNAHSALLKLKDNHIMVAEPMIFISMAWTSSIINLQWVPNENEDLIMIVVSDSLNHSEPVLGESYAVGETLSGGGKVIYIGSETSFNHTDLSPGKTYYYTAYSFNILYRYSAGIKTDATTLPGTGIESDDLNQPYQTSLLGNYPNPFNPQTVISFILSEQGRVIVEIFNIRGGKIATLLDEDLSAGKHQVLWDGKDDNGKEAGSGVYLYILKTDTYNQTKKMLLVK